MTQMAAQLWRGAHQQQVFRAVLEAMSYPGSVVTLPDMASDTETAMLAIAATLVDGEVTFCDLTGTVSADDLRKLQAASVEADAADFLMIDGATPVSITPKLGELVSPERSATILLSVATLSAMEQTDASDARDTIACTLTGPGIAEQQPLSISGLNPSWLSQRTLWNANFPLGVDCLLVAQQDDEAVVTALPRTTTVQVIT